MPESVRFAVRLKLARKTNPSFPALLVACPRLNQFLVRAQFRAYQLGAPGSSTRVCRASNARTSRPQRNTFPGTELHPRPPASLPSNRVQIAARFQGTAFSIPPNAPIESDQSDRSSSFLFANFSRSSLPLFVELRTRCNAMQAAGQNHSLNGR